MEIGKVREEGEKRVRIYLADSYTYYSIPHTCDVCSCLFTTYTHILRRAACGLRVDPCPE